MITDNKYFESRLSDINKELTAYKGDLKLARRAQISDFTIEGITNSYEEIFLTFPYNIETSSQIIEMSIYTNEVFNLYYDIIEYPNKITTTEINSIKNRFKNPEITEFCSYNINDFLDDYFHNLTFKYGSFLNNMKKCYFFVGIDNEEIIINNLLNLYRSILNDSSKQLNIFYGITLTKKISDIITSMLIDFFEQRLLVLNPKNSSANLHPQTTYIDNTLKPVEWLGTQQELCELMIELINKNWIPEISDGERKMFVKSILNIFDLVKTKRHEKSKPDDSFYQLFKGDNMNGKRYYPFLETNKYQKKFEEIKKNSR